MIYALMTQINKITTDNEQTTKANKKKKIDKLWHLIPQWWKSITLRVIISWSCSHKLAIPPLCWIGSYLLFLSRKYKLDFISLLLGYLFWFLFKVAGGDAEKWVERTASFRSSFFFIIILRPEGWCMYLHSY